MASPRISRYATRLIHLLSANPRTLVVSGIVAVLFGTAWVLGERVAANGELGLSGLGSLALLGVEVLASSVVFFAIGFSLLTWVQKFSGFRQVDNYTGFWGLKPHQRWTRLWLGFVLVWSAYWVALWPGSITQDSFRQIIQGLHLVPYSDHHPIAHTLGIEALLTPLLALTGNITVSLAAITAMQMLVLAAIFALCVDAMREFALPPWILTATYALFLLHPLTGWYSVTLWKDIWLGTFILVLGTLSAKIFFRYRLGKPISWKMWALFALSIIAIAFAKKTGVIVVLPLIIGAALYLRGRTLVRWIATGVSSVLIYLLGHALIVAALDVRPGSEVEAWSLPAQQIARTVNVHGDELSPEQKTAIARYFNNADIGERYQPWISDPIKNRLNADLLRTERAEFIALWADLAREYPVSYLDATVNQTYGYWYPDVAYWMTSASSWSDILRYNAGDNRKDTVEKKVAGELYQDLNGGKVVDVERYTPELYPLNSIRRIPIVGWLLSLGAWTWAAVALTAASIVRRTVNSRPISILSGAVWITCVLSPVFAEARYAYPILLLLPLLGALALMRPTEAGVAINLSPRSRKKDVHA